ncbi:MAG: alpha/beta hydrolase [Chloroflexi bacterium]|nr:alpha/beta hydrolase [Chloroflexota bacterium]MYE32470.1 alpha/beta hydrolase [Chloroflexota bacterium]
MTGDGAMWELPEPSATLDVQVDEHTVITVRRHGNPDGQRMVMSHGNGLAIDLYYPFWSLLADDFDLFVHDLRNHGQNAVGPLADHTVPSLARDEDAVLAAIDEHFGAKPKIGVFHSVAALATLLSPSNGSEFSALVLFDPPVVKPGISLERFDEVSLRTAAGAKQRNDRFETRGDFAERARRAPNFQRFLPGVIELMAETTLRPAPSGDGYELSCPPQYESQIIEYARLFAVGVDFVRYGCPVKVIGADPTLPFAYLPSVDLSDMVGVDYDFLPEASHFLQLERPRECVAAMLEFLELQGYA